MVANAYSVANREVFDQSELAFDVVPDYDDRVQIS